MRKVLVSDLVPGMQIARRVVGATDEVYLQPGVILTEWYIDKLKEMGYASVYIGDTLLSQIGVPDPFEMVQEEARFDIFCQIKRLFFDIIEFQRRSLTIPNDLLHSVDKLIKMVMSKTDQMVDIHDIRSDNQYLYHHSVNVGILAMIIGVHCGLERSELLRLGVGAMLHDVGKTKIPLRILHKPGMLTKEEFEIMRQHPQFGQDLLRDDPELASWVGMHHERINGEGYPQGLKKEQIPPAAQIIGLVDMFDALTVDRCYRPAYRPDEALEMLAATGGYWFDFDLVRTFVANVAAYPVGTVVELQSRQIGVVIGTAKHQPFHPTVRVFLTPQDGRLGKPYDVSTKEKGLYIVRVISNEYFTFLKRMIT